MTLYRRRLLTIIVLVVALSLTIAGCGGQEEPTPTVEPQPVNTPVPPPTETPVPPPPTDTPQPPPTNTPLPTEAPTPDVTADFITFESPEGGYALKYPGDWFTDNSFGFTALASNEALLDSPDPGEEGGIAVILGADTAEFTTDNPVQMMDGVVADFGIAEDSEITEGPTAVTINGKYAATAVINGISDNGTPLSALVTIIVDGERTVIMLAATPSETEAEFRPIFEAMAASIEMKEPVASPLPESEGMLLYGETAAASVPVDGQSTWEFIGLEGEVIDIIASPQTEDFDLVLDLLNEKGDSVLDFEIDESFGVEELRGFTLPASGTYTIAVSGFGGLGGDYEVTLAETGALTGAENTIRYGETQNGTVTSADGSTWGFLGGEGDFVDITVAPFDEFDLLVDVLDSNGQSILEAGPVDDSFDTEFIRILPLPSAGAYTIAVTGYEGTFGDYEITLDLSNGGQPGSIIFAFDTLDPGDTEGHAFPFTAMVGEVVTFQLDPEADFDAVIEIYNDDTDELLEEIDMTTGFEEAVFSVPEDGNYYFLVQGFEGSAGEYDATLLGSDRVIFELAIGDGVIGRFSEDGVIEYLFRGTAGDNLILTAETNDALDLMLELLDLDDNSLLQVDEFTAGGTETLSYSFTEDQVVFIRVSEFFGEQGQFSLLVDAE